MSAIAIKSNESVCDDTGMPKRSCPLCHDEILYKTRSRYTKAVKLNRTYRKCTKRKGRPLDLSLHKNCPKCGRIVYFSNPVSLRRSISKKAVCVSCHDRGNVGRKQGEEEKERRAKKLRGKKRSRESKKRYSISKRGNKNPKFNDHSPKSSEHRRKIRLSTIETFRKKCVSLGKVMRPSVNPIACAAIDKYGQENGYLFIHGGNGNEHYIPELGYWVDGYDANRNTVIEYYEKHHNRTKQMEKDERRRIEIVDFLKCGFIIIHENGDIKTCT